MGTCIALLFVVATALGLQSSPAVARSGAFWHSHHWKHRWKPTPSPVLTPTQSPTSAPSTTSPPTESDPPAPAPIDPPTPSPTQQPAPGPLPPAACVGAAVSAGQNLVAAVSAARPGTTLCIEPGTYRIASQLSPAAGVTLWGSPGSTIIDGSIPLSNWAKSSTGWYVSGVLPAAYSSAGQCEDNATNPCFVAERVFSNNVGLKAVTSLSALAPNTYFADFVHNQLYVGSDPGGKSVDLSRTRTAISSRAAGVTVRGLTVQKFASLPQLGAVAPYGPNWTVTGNLVRWNHGVGIMLAYANGSKVTNNTVDSNGQLGIGDHASDGVTLSGNNIENNNTDGFWIADWESGGFKASESSMVFTNNNVHGNRGVGFWLDSDCMGDTASDNTITDNAADGIRAEISYNISIHDNTVTGNGFGMGRGGGTSIYSVAGINVNTSENVDIYSNTVSGNMNGIGLQARSRGSGIHGPRLLLNATVHGNTITMTQGSIYGQGATGLVQNVNDTSYFTSRGNKFYANNYDLDSVNARRFAWNSYITISSWQQAGNDTSARITLG